MRQEVIDAMNILKPLMGFIEVDMDSDGMTLRLNDQYIAIGSSSDYEIVMEAIGWVFLNIYCTEFRKPGYLIYDELKETVNRYAVPEEVLERLGVKRP
jgi:hypothetical protein